MQKGREVMVVIKVWMNVIGCEGGVFECNKVHSLKFNGREVHESWFRGCGVGHWHTGE